MEGVTVRCDSGVVEGSNISMYYDPMISKLVTYADSREKAIDGMVAAVDQYVIEGVGHNTPFVASVCRNQSFRDGDTPTSFIDTHYPEGFSGVKLDEGEEHAMAVAVAAISSAKREILSAPPLPLSSVYDGHEIEEGVHDKIENVVVTIGGHSSITGISYAVAIPSYGDSAVIQKINDANSEWEGDAKKIDIGDLDYDPNDPISKVDIDGKERVLQIFREDAEGLMTIQMCGSVIDVAVRSPEEFHLSTHMVDPPVIDTSRMLMSPMPGKVSACGEVIIKNKRTCAAQPNAANNPIASRSSSHLPLTSETWSKLDRSCA